ncbi:tripartite tricarboxylate transporter permease [Pacificibacter marinus]|uniref:tripartite tricarboxylate transporter permease n=1 Tax=Pacificibacter marinus TaxID=658057 RepID=UPI001C07EC6A|nr:tripartite tricarboxylate transporter permease [Pacificibacter marinus]MBU2867328.1 tripartite tricarboxylate transporter permease [Pacificibacter marinus]
MELINNLGLGFTTVLTFQNLVYSFFGVLLGTLIGVLPGLGPLVAIAVLLPFTFVLDPVSSMIMLAGIFYGAQYGGSTTAILINLPGEASSIVTTLDGHEMAKQGNAGKALATAAIASFFAGCVATVIIGVFAPPLAKLAFQFGPAEYFSLMVCGLIVSVVLASGSLIKALGMMVLGLLLGIIGTDGQTGIQRFTFGVPELADGLNVAAIAMGLFGLGEIIRNLEGPTGGAMQVSKVTSLMPTRADLKAIFAPMVRGTFLGSLLGVLPGGGALLASFSAYALEKKISPTPEKFGKGAIQGVAAPEAANNAGAQTSFIPMLTLGIPSNPVMALMISALVIQGIEPGPAVITQHPELFWGVIASMWVGNLMLLVLNLPLVGLWVKLVSIPYKYLFPTVIVFACIGVYSISNSAIAVVTMAGFGMFGYVLRKLECEAAPMILGFILGPMMEGHMQRALLIGRGDPTVFLREPISAGLLILAATALALVLLPSFRRTRKLALVDDD